MRLKSNPKMKSKTRGVSIPEDLYQAVQSKLARMERGWDFSKYVQRLIQHDLAHPIVTPGSGSGSSTTSASSRSASTASQSSGGTTLDDRAKKQLRAFLEEEFGLKARPARRSRPERRS